MDISPGLCPNSHRWIVLVAGSASEDYLSTSTHDCPVCGAEGETVQVTIPSPSPRPRG